MHDEDDFLRKLLENPADDTTRMVYADWLDERGDDQSKLKAQFLRVTVRLMGPIQRHGWRSARKKELQQLAAKLPTEWLAVVSRVRVENCPRARAKQTEEFAGHYGIRFSFICEKRWDELTATDENTTMRFCEGCQQLVHYCETIDQAREQAWQGHCVAVSLGVIREGGDLEPTRWLTLGRPGII
ncbi:MAG: TIGR02996 domain-containing protein [Planctomycetia bacterium]|nr:TIGR02996 domain-containing protein [Planctomycetia bacterium]